MDDRTLRAILGVSGAVTIVASSLRGIDGAIQAVAIALVFFAIGRMPPTKHDHPPA